MNKQGETGAYSIHQWFSYNKYVDKVNTHIQSDFLIKFKTNLCQLQQNHIKVHLFF